MNDDNCGSGFYAETQEQMRENVCFWLRSHARREFVRFAVVVRGRTA